MARFLVCVCAAALSLWAAPVRVLVVYDSRTGNTAAMAQAVRDGAASVAGVETALKKTGEATAEDIVSADGIVLGSPVYWQNLTPEAKAFLDRMGAALAKAGKTLGEGRTAGVFCTAGAVASGKDLTRLSAIAAFLAMRFIVIGGVDEEGFGTLGPQATTAGAKPGGGEKERAEARRFGDRFARLTAQIRGAIRK